MIASDEHRLHHPVEPHLFGGELLAPREVPARAEVILEALRRDGQHEVRSPTPIDDVALGRVHETAYLEFLSSAHRRWCDLTGLEGGEAMPFVRPYLGIEAAEPDHVLAQLGRFSHDADPVLAGTWTAARASASSAVTATEAVLQGRAAAYSLSRPPGHHAAPSSFGGYCYLNNVAVATEAAVAAGARVATLDVDAHAGNGTQCVFWSRGDVLCVSLHADPRSEYPFFAGHADERGAGAGEGATLNLPLPGRSDWRRYAPALDEACERVSNHGADLLVVALGVDSAVEDGVLALAGDDYRRLGERIVRLGLPTVFVQEGGYELSVLGDNVAAVLEGFEQHL